MAFAVGDSYPACLVTGGRGTIEVKHEGKSYWVCCSGCKELFEFFVEEAVLLERLDRVDGS